MWFGLASVAVSLILRKQGPKDLELPGGVFDLFSDCFGVARAGSLLGHYDFYNDTGASFDFQLHLGQGLHQLDDVLTTNGRVG
jgi:hypothetical protein